MSKNVALYLNAVERTIQYKSVQKQINDSYWETDILPILYPLWDNAKDKLEIFVYNNDNSYLIQRTKYKKNFKTGEFKWVSYEFDPGSSADYSVVELKDSLIEKFIQYKDIIENTYEQAIIREYERTNSITWKKINLVRKFLLQDSDFIFSSDYNIDDQTKSLWSQYRQYIRDLPEIQTIETPLDVFFPITPDEYLKRKELYIEPQVSEMVGDQGINDDYLTSSYHFWKMNSNTLSTYAQRMSFYIASKVATSDYESNTRVMVSEFITKFTANPGVVSERINQSNDSLNLDFIDSLLTKIETGEL